MSTFREELEEFGKFSRSYSGEVWKEKKEGKKIVCYYGSKVPVEIIHASGALQYPLFDGGDSEPAEAALPFLLPVANIQSLYQVGQHELGLNPVTPIADLIIIDCKETDSVRVGDIFEFKGLPVMKLGVPQDWGNEIAFNYYKLQLSHLKEKLEKLTGKEITNESLINSIKKYNRIRQLLNEIGSLRKKNPPVIGGADFIKLNHYALKNDPDVAVSSLEKLYDRLTGEKSRFSEKVVRLMVAGRGFAFGDYTLLQMIEKAGGVVVTELLDEGMVHPGEVKLDEAPIEKIAEFYYRGMVPSCFFTPSFAKRWEEVERLKNEYQASGLLYYMLRFDVIYDHETPIFSKRADEKNVPFTIIESSYDFSRESTETLQTRVESFVKICDMREVINEKKRLV
ncbi:MAG: 2-hydroxyacyl-CoA dehydratase subunit D [Dissulfuribacterales bacterium]